jgi:hypothetical protein
MAHLKEIKPLLQSRLAFLQQCAHISLTEKSLDFATLLLGLNKGMDLMEGSESDSKYQLPSLRSRSKILCKQPNILQHTRRQFCACIGLEMNNDDGVEQFMSLLYQPGIVIFVLFHRLGQH